jgi:putative nucleotidyltransferase with HDIG domain
MVSSGVYDQLNKRFRNYLAELKMEDEFVKDHVDFKIKHTYHVIKNIREIAQQTGLTPEDTELAKIIALVHDIGRFEQFITYHTFDDKISVNHAESGIHIMNRINFLDGTMSPDENELITKAVLNHNIFRLDPDLEERVSLFSRLIRDADKLDIWEILIDRDIVNQILDSSKIETSYEVPDQILNCFRNQQVVPSGAVLMNDHRFLRLSWIYDMNFTATYKLIIEREYAEKILARIPSSQRKEEIAAIIHDFVRKKAAD